MNRLISIACLALACATAGAAEPVEVPLERVSIERPDSLLYVTAPYVRAQARPDALKKLPAALEGKKLKYFVVQVAGRPMVTVMPVDDVQSLYVDHNLDGDLSDEKPTEAERGRMQDFGLREVKLDDRPVKLKLVGYGGRVLMAYNPVRLKGHVDLGGNKREVVLLDADRDGRYDSRFQGKLEAVDALGIDLNGDGRVLRYSRDGSVEAFPLPRLLELGGSWYGLAVVDGEAPKLVLEPVEPVMGTLKTRRGTMLALMGESGFHRLSGKAESYTLPEGNYIVVQSVLKKADEQGAEWTLSGQGLDTVMTLSKDQPVKAPAGEPLTVKPVIRKLAHQTLQINVSVEGVGGETYAAGAMHDGKRAAAPTYKVLDAKGNVLAQGAMKYG